MKEFMPWSKATYETAISKYRAGRFSILDVQISGKCNFNCIYCDSPDRNKPCDIDFKHLCKLVRQEPEVYDWMYICGLGEPLWLENKTALMTLLALCRELNIKCTIFTNGSQMDEGVLDYIRDGVLFPIIKIDTFSLAASNEIYGTNDAKKTLSTIDKLFDISAKTSGYYSTIAASIVPTTKNLNEILDIVRRCCDNNVFPLLGQLEYAGKAVVNYSKLLLSREVLVNLKTEIDFVLNEKYEVPICPSVIAGIHITNDGYVSVDQKSGLSCSWFWLETPQIVRLCDVNAIDSLSKADTKIFKYRKSVINQMAVLSEQIEEYPFGGCGGNVCDLAREYVRIQSSLTITNY